MPVEIHGSATLASGAILVNSGGRYLRVDDAPVYESDADSPSIYFDHYGAGADAIPIRPNTVLRDGKVFRRFWIVSNTSRSIGQRVSYTVSQSPLNPIQSDVPAAVRSNWVYLDTQTVSFTAAVKLVSFPLSIPESVERLAFQLVPSGTSTTYCSLRVYETVDLPYHEQFNWRGVVGKQYIETPPIAAINMTRNVTVVLANTETSSVSISVRIYGIRSGGGGFAKNLTLYRHGYDLGTNYISVNASVGNSGTALYTFNNVVSSQMMMLQFLKGGASSVNLDGLQAVVNRREKDTSTYTEPLVSVDLSGDVVQCMLPGVYGCCGLYVVLTRTVAAAGVAKVAWNAWG